MMDIRISNESTANDDALVRVYDVPPEDGNILPREDKEARAVLAPGQSVVVTIGPDRFVMLDAAPTAIRGNA